jgi:CTP:molybdopterin cytidylyltransferase MocA
MDRSRMVVAVVAAGQTTGEVDPLADFTRGRPKALLPISGRPMVAYVVDALAGSRYVQHVAMIALDPAWEVPFPVPVDYVDDTGGLFTNVEAGFNYALEHYPGLDAVLCCSSDVPLLTTQIVDAFIAECLRSDHDIYYPVIERQVMERRFPGSRRSYVHLREGDFCGGVLMLLRPTLTIQQRQTLRSLVDSRKRAWEQARTVGLGLLLKLLLRRLSLADAERRVAQVLGVRGRVVPFPYAEIGMDVDKPLQLDIARAELEL